MNWTARILLAAVLTGCGARDGDSPPKDVSLEDPSKRDLAPGELLATYYPTPDVVIDRMFELGELEAGELLYDLGSGDGRIVIRAVEERRARAVGFEIDRDLVALSRRRLAERGLAERARIVEQDLLEADFSLPDVVTIFLTPEGVRPLAPVLIEGLKTGARVVSYKFPLPGWEPHQTVSFDDADPETPRHRLYVYRVTP